LLVLLGAAQHLPQSHLLLLEDPSAPQLPPLPHHHLLLLPQGMLVPLPLMLVLLA
jgi:hypothetical protein